MQNFRSALTSGILAAFNRSMKVIHSSPSTTGSLSNTLQRRVQINLRWCVELASNNVILLNLQHLNDRRDVRLAKLAVVNIVHERENHTVLPRPVEGSTVSQPSIHLFNLRGFAIKLVQD
jgi:hypothetical protein